MVISIIQRSYSLFPKGTSFRHSINYSKVFSIISVIVSECRMNMYDRFMYITVTVNNRVKSSNIMEYS